MKLLIELDEEYVKAIDKIKFLVGGRTDRKLQLEIIKAIKNGKALDQEPTTKNDLGVDCISKQAVLNKILKFSVTDGRSVSVTSLWTEVNELPLVPPQEPQSFKWCDTCKEYDQEKHCCHRYSKVIRDTVAEIEQEPRWIPVSERLPASNQLNSISISKNDLGVDWDELKRKILMEVDSGTDDAWLAYGDVCNRISNSIDEFVADMRG